MADKVVHVPGKGLMSFPDDMSDDQVAGAIRSHLQSLGQAALAAAPAPIARLGAALQARFIPMSGNVQRTTNNSQPMTAGVQQGSPNVIEVRNPAQFNNPVEAQQLAAHETTHLIENNLPGPLQAAIPADNPTDPYNYGGDAHLAALRAAGGNVLSLPREQAAAVVQHLTAQRQMYQRALAAHAVTPALHQQLKQTEAVEAPFVNDFNHLPLSVVKMTPPDYNGIVTTPRAPLPPPGTLPE